MGGGGGGGGGGGYSVRPVERAPLKDRSIIGFQVVRHQREGAPDPWLVSAGQVPGSQATGTSASGPGVPKLQSYSHENVRLWVSGPRWTLT